MLIENGRSYIVGFEKPWYVTRWMLAGWAQKQAIQITGFWPKGHPEVPPISPPNVKPYSHVLSGTMIGPSQEMSLPSEIAWIARVGELRMATEPKPFTVQRRKTA